MLGLKGVSYFSASAPWTPEGKTTQQGHAPVVLVIDLQKAREYALTVDGRIYMNKQGAICLDFVLPGHAALLKVIHRINDRSVLYWHSAMLNGTLPFETVTNWNCVMQVSPLEE